MSYVVTSDKDGPDSVFERVSSPTPRSSSPSRSGPCTHGRENREGSQT